MIACRLGAMSGQFAEVVEELAKSGVSFHPCNLRRR